MTDLHRGTLKVTKKGQKTMVQVLIDDKPFNLAEGQLSSDLKPVDGLEVEFLRVGGQPQQIRAVGQNFVTPGMAKPSPAVQDRRAQRSAQNQPKQAGPRFPQTQTQAPGEQAIHDGPDRDFHNPYNFIPAPPRKTDDPDLGDCPPVPHDTFDPKRYSGRIRVRMIVKTPLLVPDSDLANVREDSNGHKTFRLRVDENGLPSIPASSVRGMLRSAYEAVTNSRFGRFSRTHRNRLAFRMDARDSLRLIPARIENGQIRLLIGTSHIGNEGRPNGPMYAAWLPRYKQGQLDALRFPDDSLPQHRDAVTCWVVEKSHRSGRFSFWGVRNIFRRGQVTGIPDLECVQVDGYVCITNANIKGKHDERVFFIYQAPPTIFQLTDAQRVAWRELIANYQETHEEDLRRRRSRQQDYDQYLGPEPGRTAWSRQVYTFEDRDLAEGTLCYVRLNADRTDVEALFPVMITRELYSASPWRLLHSTLHPAASIDDLSPADRVFGWVAPMRTRPPRETKEIVSPFGVVCASGPSCVNRNVWSRSRRLPVLVFRWRSSRHRNRSRDVSTSPSHETAKRKEMGWERSRQGIQRTKLCAVVKSTRTSMTFLVLTGKTPQKTALSRRARPGTRSTDGLESTRKSNVTTRIGRSLAG